VLLQRFMCVDFPVYIYMMVACQPLVLNINIGYKMKTKCFSLLFLFLLSLPLASLASKNTVVVLNTTMGSIEIELFEQEAPIGTMNFLKYAESGFYQNVIFHRIIKGFMIQGGGFDRNMNRKKVNAPIKNEAKNGKLNIRGTLSYARTNNVDSATSQFFINLVDNHFLDYKNDRKYGYAVFGRVIKGLDVVDRIGSVKTGYLGRHKDVPLEPVIIKSVTVKKPQ